MITEFKSSIASARTAILSQDYATALVHARAARMALTAIAKSELDREQIEYSREDLDAMIRDLQRSATAQQNASAGGPFSSTDIVYTRH